MSRFTFLTALSLVLLSAVFASTSAFSLGSGTCHATADAVTRGTGKHPITPQLGFYLSGLPVQYAAGATYNFTITNTKKNPAITYLNGYLLYAIDANGNRQGTFQPNPQGTTNLAWAQEAQPDNSGVFACENAPAATLTHNSAGQKPIDTLNIQWTAPSQDVGPLTWRGLVESTMALQYTQVLTPWRQCDAYTNTCTAFDPSTLPSDPLPPPPQTGGVQPFGLAAIDQSACGNFTPVAFGAVPPGFCASVYATVNRPRAIYVTDQGDMLVVETGAPTGILLLRDLNGNGVIDGESERTRILTANSLNHGLYVHHGYLYYTNPNTVWRVRFDSMNPTAQLNHADATVVIKNIPGGGHATRTPLISHDNRWLYVSVGSAGNLDEDDSRSRVVRYDLNGAIPTGGWQWNDYSNQHIQAFAKGLRNEVGLALDLHGDVWGVMNADDNLNRPDLGGYDIHNDNPAERVDHLRESQAENGWYGYPFCWAADILANHSNGQIFAWGGDGKNWYRDGEHSDAWCRENTIPPSYALQAHTAPLGLVFYDGRGRYAFPPEYYNQIFVAEHGSWNSDSPRGYKVARIGTDERGEALASTSRDFFAYKGPGAPWPGQNPVRPVEVRVGPEGEMYVSSDSSSQIIVIRHINDRHTPVLMPQLVSSGYTYSTIGGPTKATAEFSFDEPRTQGTYRWLPGTYPRVGVAQFDGASLHVNMTAADNNAGAASPNTTGGNSTYEMWIKIDPVPSAANAAYVIMELLEPGMTAAQDDYLRILATVSQDGANAYLSAVSKQPGQAEVAIASMSWGVPTGVWTHISLVLSGGMGALCEAGTRCTAAGTSGVSLKGRRSALLGHSHRYDGGATLANFTGYLDDVRLYSYALSESQRHLNYLLSVADRTNPVLQANLHMQPPENTEAAYMHFGPSNHYQPQQPTNLLPGWIFLNGSQLINLSNPMSGLGHAWKGDLFDTSRSGRSAPAMALEFWFRLWGVDQLSEGVTLLNAMPVVRSYWSQKQLHVQCGGESHLVPFTPSMGWTHFVFVASPAEGGNSYYTSYINGSQANQQSGSGFKGGAVGNAVTLGGDLSPERRVQSGMLGDLGIFRVYDFALNATHVRALFAAQIEEGRRLRQQARALGLPAVADDDSDDDGFPVLSAAAIVGIVLSISVLVTAVVVLAVWRMQKARGVARSARMDGYSAELMADAH